MVKTIAIMNEVYEELVRRKRPNESFSKELMRIIGERRPITDFAGVWKMSDEDIKKMKDAIKESRIESTKRTMERIKEWNRKY